jgi:glucosyl-3-phosphoglycerate synthase
LSESAPSYDENALVSAWLTSRRYHAGSFDNDLLKANASVAVVIVASECADTVADVLRDTIRPFVEQGIVDELLVVGMNSRDGTAQIAESCGAQVIQADAVLSSFGPVRGKGDAMWRAVYTTRSDIVCFLDADTLEGHPSHLRGLLGPLLTMPDLKLVKGAFSRPLPVGDHSAVDHADRITELMARPWLNLHEPRLAGFSQPLAGEFAARRELLEAVPFPVGSGVEAAVLMDALRLHGLDALAECELGTRQSRHRPLRALGATAYAALAAMENRRSPPTRVVASRLLQPWNDGASIVVEIDERPPLRSLMAHAPRADRTSD